MASPFGDIFWIQDVCHHRRRSVGRSVGRWVVGRRQQKYIYSNVSEDSGP